MSETVSYRTTAVISGTESAIRDALRRRNMLPFDEQGWTTARERADKIQEIVKQEMAKYCGGDMPNMSDLQMAVIQTDAMIKGLSEVSAFNGFAAQLHGPEMCTIRKGLEELKQNIGVGCPSANLQTVKHLQNSLETIATSAQQHICEVEKMVLSDQVTIALKDLGYIVERSGDALKATMEKNCIWLETNCWGEITLDYSGFSGMSCLNETRRVEEQFKKQGLLVERRCSVNHSRPEGGALVQKLEPLFPVFRKFENKNHDSQKSNKNILKGAK